MPIGDWQFWVVSLAAVGGVLVLVKQFKPVRKHRKTQLTISARERDEA